MRGRPVQYLAAGMTLVGLSAAGLISPTISRFMDLAAAWVGSGPLAWALLLVIAFALMLTGAAELAREALIRNEMLRYQGAMAEARSVSLFSDEALTGVLALGDMGRRVEIERQASRIRSGLMTIGAAGVLALGGIAVVFGLRQSAPPAGVLAAFAAPALAAAILLAFARSIAKSARAIAPTEEQVHAALARHQERQEAERRMLRPSLAVTSVAGDAPRAPAL